MTHKTALRLTATITGLLGLLALIFNVQAYHFFARTIIAVPAPGADDEVSLAVWTTFSFLRLASAFLLCLGVVVWQLSNIEGPDIQRRICRALSQGFVIILVVAFMQQTAIWSPAAWSLIALLLILTVAYYKLSISPKTVSGQA